MQTVISKPHLEVLGKEAEELFDSLASIADSFCLCGGTSIALQIGHRKSYDFDFFTTHLIKSNFAAKVHAKFDIKNVEVNTDSELTLYTNHDIKITFLQYEFDIYKQIVKFENGINTIPLTTLAATKAYTIGRRGAFRDYFDLYTILNQKHITWELLVARAVEIYGGLFSEKLLLEQLVYMDDIHDYTIVTPDNTVTTPKDEVLSYFKQLSAALLS